VSQRSSFFDSVTGDRVYNSDFLSRAYRWCSTDGYVTSIGSQLQVTQQTPVALGVTVALGAAWVQGRNFEVFSTTENLSLSAANPTLHRIDRIVIRLNTSTRTVVLAVLTGTPASSPVAPSLTRTATIYELSLARVAVSAGATSISNANITDERDDAAVCGRSRHPAQASTFFPGARVYRSTVQSIPNNTITAVSFDVVRFDTSTPLMWSGANPTRLTCPSAGIYVVSGTVGFAANATGNDREAFIRVNGSQLIASIADRNPSAYVEQFTVSAIWRANTSDYFELCVRHDRGSSLDIVRAADYSPEFGVAKMSD